MPTEFWFDVDPEWHEIHPDLIDEVFDDLMGEMEARGYIGPGQGGGATSDQLPLPPFADEDDEDEQPLARRRRRRKPARKIVSLPQRIGRFFRRLFGG